MSFLTCAECLGFILSAISADGKLRHLDTKIDIDRLFRSLLPRVDDVPIRVRIYTRTSNIPGSKLTFSTNLFHHSLIAPTWTAFSDYTGPDLLCSTLFHF